ncbi:tail fiber hinge [Stenotrophomonas phage IME13]|uniref:Tail fiber hinge n=1 Tax=Stenotrophomonas phage IME13 TaxID=1211280 RepID=J7I4K5_9CAUD|nr:long tail fiber protein proximal connector [Stenotrophomonas phage IME13]AFQ22700.1 tail fiber hinge [Stenotrophomonas phage IME13]
MWTKFEGYFKLPTQSSGAKIFASAAYRYPSNVSAGTAGVRNVTITRVTRDDDDKVADAAIGVNGIRANSISNNGNYTNPVLQLLNLKPNNIITSNDFNER